VETKECEWLAQVKRKSDKINFLSSKVVNHLNFSATIRTFIGGGEGEFS